MRSFQLTKYVFLKEKVERFLDRLGRFEIALAIGINSIVWCLCLLGFVDHVVAYGVTGATLIWFFVPFW
jgi:hypothetical protein